MEYSVHKQRSGRDIGQTVREAFEKNNRLVLPDFEVRFLETLGIGPFISYWIVSGGKAESDGKEIDYHPIDPEINEMLSAKLVWTWLFKYELEFEFIIEVAKRLGYVIGDVEKGLDIHYMMDVFPIMTYRTFQYYLSKNVFKYNPSTTQIGTLGVEALLEGRHVLMLKHVYHWPSFIEKGCPIYEGDPFYQDWERIQELKEELYSDGVLDDRVWAIFSKIVSILRLDESLFVEFDDDGRPRYRSTYNSWVLLIDHLTKTEKSAVKQLKQVLENKCVEFWVPGEQEKRGGNAGGLYRRVEDYLLDGKNPEATFTLDQIDFLQVLDRVCLDNKGFPEKIVDVFNRILQKGGERVYRWLAAREGPDRKGRLLLGCDKNNYDPGSDCGEEVKKTWMNFINQSLYANAMAQFFRLGVFLIFMAVFCISDPVYFCVVVLLGYMFVNEYNNALRKSRIEEAQFSRVINREQAALKNLDSEALVASSQMANDGDKIVPTYDQYRSKRAEYPGF